MLRTHEGPGPWEAWGPAQDPEKRYNVGMGSRGVHSSCGEGQETGWVEAKVGPDYTNVGGGVHGELKGKEREAGSEEERDQQTPSSEPCPMPSL